MKLPEPPPLNAERTTSSLFSVVPKCVYPVSSFDVAFFWLIQLPFCLMSSK
jgi:hypothetical protein